MMEIKLLPLTPPSLLPHEVAQEKTPSFDGVKMVDPSGFEPLTSSMPLRRSTN